MVDRHAFGFSALEFCSDPALGESRKAAILSTGCACSKQQLECMYRSHKIVWLIVFYFLLLFYYYYPLCQAGPGAAKTGRNILGRVTTRNVTNP